MLKIVAQRELSKARRCKLTELFPDFIETSLHNGQLIEKLAKTGEIDRKQTFYRFCRNETADEGFPQHFCRCHERIAKFPIPR